VDSFKETLPGGNVDSFKQTLPCLQPALLLVLLRLALLLPLLTLVLLTRDVLQLCKLWPRKAAAMQRWS
jgi:hypothetical protein